jgi:uncharacterized Fe-S cluster protein YjdI
MEMYENQFANGEITVTYEPKKCIHADKCCKGLASVFRNSVIPWIDLEGAESNQIISQIKQCPSGALSYVMKKELVEAQ